MPIWGRKIKGEKSHKNRFGEGLGLHLGGVWGDLGRLLGALGRLLAILGAFKIELFFNIGPRWSPRGLLDRFGVLLGGSWASFFALGRFLGASSAHFAHLAAFVVAISRFLCVLGRSGLDFGGVWDALGRAVELSEVHFWRVFRARTLAMRKTSECVKTTVFPWFL